MQADFDDCWQQIGVAGNRKCPELSVVGHCHNCGCFSDIAVRMFDRAPPEGYVEQATEWLAGNETVEARDTLAVIVFRLAGQWLALPASIFEEVAPLRPICPIPHRANNILLGFVNVRGMLHLCVSMAAMLDIGPADGGENEPGGSEPRMLVISREGQRWAFAADEVCGIHPVAAAELLESPATAANLPVALAKANFAWREMHAGLLDEHRLFDALRRTVS